MTKNKTNIEVVQDLAVELLTLMGSKAGIEVKEEGEDIIVNIVTEEETGLLIGHHGQTLLSIQTILGLMTKNALGEWKRVVVNVGDWRQKEEEQLIALAHEVAERVKQTGEAQPLYNLTPAQRRIIHMELAKDSELVSESQGEGVERYLVVNLKK